MAGTKTVIRAGTNYADMLSVFRTIVTQSGLGKGDPVIWAGCPGTCYSMATFLCWGLRDLGLDLYFAADAEISRLSRLELAEDAGVRASTKVDPVRARAIVLMSGLMRVPFENVTTLVRESLEPGGILIGETVVPGFFDAGRWADELPLDFVFEFAMERPTAFELGDARVAAP